MLVALYQERRERAAAFWRGIAPGRFDMRQWECGSTACALGWLALTKYEGWSMSRRTDVPVAPDGSAGTSGAMAYFGLSIDDSRSCFGAGWASVRLYGGKEFELMGNLGLQSLKCRVLGPVSPGQVADALLAMPITLPEVGGEVVTAAATATSSGRSAIHV